MRRLIASTFTSLDGIMQAPGGPEEDPTGGFTLGGWTFNYWDQAMDISASGFDGKDRELVLGRRTYEIFEAYWPYQPDDNPVARTLNAAKKYVASRTLTTLHWNNSTLLHGDAVSAIIALKTQPGPDLQIIGSGNLIQTLQAASLIDEYNVWTFPVVLGRGKRLFGETTKPFALRLVRSQVSTTGVVMSTYVPSGDIQPGSFASDVPSENELARRKKIANEMKMMSKNTICLWYEGTALEAAQFYAETFPDSVVGTIHRAPGDYPAGKEGDVLMVEFNVIGIPCIGLNGGPDFKHNEAFSFQVATDDQAETDRLWNAIVSNGGQESVCGWCKDKWGLSWQITPRALTAAIADPDRAAAKRAFQAMMQMGKIDIAAIEAARHG